jgi:hypothetical protein
MPSKFKLETGCIAKIKATGVEVEVLLFSPQLGEWETTQGWFKPSDLEVIAPSEFEHDLDE